jgi:hypothetical protein
MLGGVLGTTSVGMLSVSSFSTNVVATFLPFLFPPSILLLRWGLRDVHLLVGHFLVLLGLLGLLLHQLFYFRIA